MSLWWIVEDIDRTDASKSVRFYMNLIIIQNKVVYTHVHTLTDTLTLTHVIDLRRKLYSVTVFDGFTNQLL
jgi:hypothetical protein